MNGDEKTGRTENTTMEASMEELREFLEGDLVGVRVDPEFKERLRRKLWELVRARNTTPAKS
ncbi:MAG: hypothetical protein VX546_08695 [Myxococcota bacterium]|nr:hypothetical protein [Myxococcota bacterium]